ncbi:FliH/SctL family protein [Antarcticimicrobium luteum]|uniref:Uncharacterized protein n=1 Tax=Antarcticimicrobium luteum TaxID=2547397 RepID=A0A4R5VD48_9RHOB|nr:FliH/SctL family protein [Antarcticimicrobium luteum]TDK50191.1 hypothetical protein E1832_07220 [Antarcticimicrobium luteum]
MNLFLRDFDAEAMAANRQTQPEAAAGQDEVPRGPNPEELERLLADTREAALAQGRAEGAATARAEAEAGQAARIAAALDLLQGQFAQLLAQDGAHRRALERDVVEMLVEIGERIAPDLLAEHSADLARAQIRAGLRMAGGSPQMTIRVAPTLEPALQAQLAGLAQAGGAGAAAPRLIADQGLGEGDVRLDWDNGRLDYSLERACEVVLSALREAAAKLNDDQGKVG